MLSVTLSKLIAVTVSLCSCTPTAYSAPSSWSQKLLQQQSQEQHNEEQEVIPYFESPEHAAIGDRNVLRFLNATVLGSDFNNTVKDTNLSFGDVIALAGDFYAAWQLTACAPSISDDWGRSTNATLRVAEDNVEMLRTDSGNKLACVLPLIKSQRDAVLEARGNGSDVAQDAESAYSATHVLALDKALEGYKTQNESMLKEAYFIDGYAQHFLTDGFSAGHIRTPRRMLHSTSLDLKLMPGDQCSKKQHDEDNACGLWVTNREGYSWAAHGDKFLLQGRSARNLYMLHETTQASLNEVWTTFLSGEAPNVSDFTARQKMPLPDKTLEIGNFVPLFEPDPDDGDMILFRQDIDQRAKSAKRERMTAKQDNTAWSKLLTKIEDSSSMKNRYTFTKSFRSKQEVFQIGAIHQDSSKLVINKYGLVDAGSWGHNWGLNFQGIIDMPQANSEVSWTDIRLLGDNIYALVGKLKQESIESYALHMGFRTSQISTGRLQIEPLWSQTTNDGNAFLTPGDILYGVFDTDSDLRVMVKYFQGQKPNSYSTIEIWALNAESFAPPNMIKSLAYSDVNFLISHRIDRDDDFSVVVGYGTASPDSPSPGTWVISSWNSQYKSLNQWKFPEPSARRPQMILSDPISDQLIRIFYGHRYHQDQTIQIDLVRPRWDNDHSTLRLDDTITQEYSITWNNTNEDDYLTWFIEDIDRNGSPDLITYTTSHNTIINVIVFPGQSDGTYGTPIVSNITLDPSIGKDLTGTFMRPLYTTRSSYLYRYNDHEETSTTSAIMSFFDNHGVLGMRIIAPVNPTGSLEYELKGQDPAIAGQRSTTLGTRAGDWMGHSRRPVALGIVPLGGS